MDFGATRGAVEALDISSRSEAAARPQSTSRGFGQFEPTTTLSAPTLGFRWGDAAIGAGATLGIVLLLAGLGAALLSRHNRRPPMARA
jgi:hypothetical protein